MEIWTGLTAFYDLTNILRRMNGVRWSRNRNYPQLDLSEAPSRTRNLEFSRSGFPIVYYYRVIGRLIDDRSIYLLRWSFARVRPDGRKNVLSFFLFCSRDSVKFLIKIHRLLSLSLKMALLFFVH